MNSPTPTRIDSPGNSSIRARMAVFVVNAERNTEPVGLAVG